MPGQRSSGSSVLQLFNVSLMQISHRRSETKSDFTSAATNSQMFLQNINHSQEENLQQISEVHHSRLVSAHLWSPASSGRSQLTGGLGLNRLTAGPAFGNFQNFSRRYYSSELEPSYTAAAEFLVPPTVRSLSLSSATSGGVTSRGQQWGETPRQH
ncbi:hypothetical protein GOODEAATRI_015604 [Goodea atripinnis]|uniref:Uncharacterized protein n=1 Tax=Goodea atripinnis TaxID=208336 RepID=A0ABV0NY85_9TELE